MEITERDVSSIQITLPTAPVHGSTTGFPQVSKYQQSLDDELDREQPAAAAAAAAGGGGPVKRRSLFARQAERQGLARKAPVSAAQDNSSSSTGLPTSYIIDGTGLRSADEVTKIHLENVRKLQAMSVEEILAAQQELSASLDPKILTFLQKKRPAAASVLPPKVQSPPPDVTMTDLPRILEEEARQGPTPMDTRSTDPGVKPSAQPDFQREMEELEKVKTQLPVDIDELRKYPSMANVEPEKLRWLTSLPPPPADVKNSQTGYTARFNFEGDLLAYDADPPTQSALYHHGQEPERAGYSVEEMLRLSRSTVLQQRTLGLQTLNNVIRKAKSGQYDEVVDPPLIGRLLDAGLLLLLRFAIDENTEAVLSAALGTLESLVDNYPDEVCLDRVFGWRRGVEQPALPSRVDTVQETKQRYQQEEAGLKDDDVTRLDVIRAVVRTGTLPRLRYILEVLKPPPPAVISIVRLLTRCARHSLQLAAELVSCPRLVDTLVDNFLPVCGHAPLDGGVSVSSMTSVYGVPLHHVVKLLRVICSQSAQLASQLTKKYDVIPAILSYVAINPSESGMPTQEVLTLAIESYRLWITLLSYNFGDTHFIEFFPLLMRQLHFYLRAVSVNATEEGNKYNYDLATCLVLLCQTAAGAAWSNHHTELLNRTSGDPLVPGALRWDHVTGLLEPIQLCTQKWLEEVTRLKEPTDSVLQLLGACLTFLGVYHERWALLGLDDTVPRLAALQRLSDVILTPFVTSHMASRLLEGLSGFSCLLSGLGSGRRRDPLSLPSVTSVTWGQGQVCPVLRAGSPVPLLAGLLQLTRAVCRLHRGLAEKLCAPLLSHGAVASYLTSLGHSQLALTYDWFTRYEVHLTTDLILLATDQGFSAGRDVVHTAGLCLLPCYQAGDQHLCAELMRHVVFNHALILPSQSAQNRSESSVSQLFTEAAGRLPAACSLYQSCLLSAAGAAISRQRADSLAGRLAALASAHTGETAGLLPVDWWYAPLMQLYERHNSDSKEDQTGRPAGRLHGLEPEAAVARVLQLLHVLFTCRRHVLHVVSVTSHFARLCCVFLAGDDLFLSVEVQRYLGTVLRQVLTPADLLDLTAAVPGLASFSDLFAQLLDQFEGVSYGDPVFGAVILVPLHPRHPVQHRRLVWLERTHVLRSITTKPEQMLIPLDSYLTSRETDDKVRQAYRWAVTSGQVMPARNSALYQIASALGASGAT